jgi:hypothetical protein
MLNNKRLVTPFETFHPDETPVMVRIVAAEFHPNNLIAGSQVREGSTNPNPEKN